MFVVTPAHLLFTALLVIVVVALVGTAAVWLATRPGRRRQLAAGQQRSVEQRLAELSDLHARGVISGQELAEGRARIIGGD